MNKKERRAYVSPLRESQAQATRDLILRSVAQWMESGDGKPLTLDAIAKSAGIQTRTVLRHFQTKEALLEAFWTWVNVQITPQILPDSLEDLLNLPRRIFSRFDEQEGIIRGSLHSRAGQEMRRAAIPNRRKAFSKVIREELPHLDPETRRRILAMAHLLGSASAWETLRDYAGLSGRQAGETAAWALSILIDAVGGSSPTQNIAKGNKNMSATLSITRPPQAKSVWVVRDTIRFMGHLDGTELSVLEVEVPPGSGTPPHQHESPEIFRVLRGSITFGTLTETGMSASAEESGAVVTVPS